MSVELWPEHECRHRMSWFYYSQSTLLRTVNPPLYSETKRRLTPDTYLKTQTKTSRMFVSSSAWRPVQEEPNQELDDVVIQTHHLSVLHALVQPQALGAPQQVLSGVVGVGFHRQGHGVELVAEEGEEVAVWDHGLRHEGPRDVLEVPETCRGNRKVWFVHPNFSFISFISSIKKTILKHNVP